MAIKFASLKILARVTSVLPKKSCSLDLFESILFSFPSRRHEPPFFVLCHYSLQIYLKIFIKSIEIFATATKFELTRGFVQSNLWDSHAVVDVWELQYLYLTMGLAFPNSIVIESIPKLTLKPTLSLNPRTPPNWNHKSYPNPCPSSIAGNGVIN